MPRPEPLADFTYLGTAIERSGAEGSAPEYPWLAAAVYELPLRAGVSTWSTYYASMIALFLLVDAGFALWLWRAGGRRATPGFVTWLALFPALGPLAVTRFDIVTGALAGGAALAYSASRPALGGALAALGAGFKLWPALALPALLVPGGRAERRAVLAGAAIAAAAVVVLTLAAAGLPRLGSPFFFQMQRGLQVEAFAALPLLWAHHFGALTGSAIVTAPLCKCFELQGAAAGAALSAASAARWLGIAGLALLFLRAWRAPEAARTPALALQLTVISVLVLIATNKAFSPQYMLWIAAPLAALGVLPGQRLPRADIVLLIAACVATQAIFPWNYNSLALKDGATAPMLAVLTLRDALLVALGARLAAQVWRACARA